MTKINEIIFRLRQFNSEVIQDIADDLENEITELLKELKDFNYWQDNLTKAASLINKTINSLENWTIKFCRTKDN